MNRYKELKDKRKKDITEFPMFWAFNQMQFDEGMRQLGLEPHQISEVCRMPAGGISRKSDVPRFNEMIQRHGDEMRSAIEADTTGDGFIFDMFYYELWNYEYLYTRDVTETLDALGLTIDVVNASEKLKHGLKKAIAAQRLDEESW